MHETKNKLMSLKYHLAPCFFLVVLKIVYSWESKVKVPPKLPPIDKAFLSDY